MQSLFTFEEVHRTWLECRRGKRSSHGALAFERDLERQLTGLLDGLRNRTYEPSPYTCFVSDGPKPREIFAAPFRDRIVHTLLVRRLEPLWEPRFIHDSHGCRLGRGPLRAVERLQGFMRQATRNETRRAWFLQIDIRSFFVSIRRQVLYDLIADRLRRTGAPRASDLAWLSRVILAHEPTAGVIRRGRGFERIPLHKSLFGAARGVGLPIGNHTSQFFANVYLDPLDQFIKRQLKVRHYVRFVDDMVLVDPDPERLMQWQAEIESYLGPRLGLRLHPTRRTLAPVTNGCDFLGYIVRPSHRLVRRRIVNRLRHTLDECREAILQRVGDRTRLTFRDDAQARLAGAVASYRGILRHAAARRLAMDLVGRHLWLQAALIAHRSGVRRRDVLSGRSSTLADQYRGARRQFPGAVVLFQIGCYVEAFGRGARFLRRELGLREGRGRKGLGRGSGFRADRMESWRHRLAATGRRVVVFEQTGRVRGALAERRAVWLVVPRRIHRFHPPGQGC
jgi:RNA-directed DNA polymerase